MGPPQFTVLLGDRAGAGGALQDASLQDARDAAWGAEALGLPLGIDLIDGVAAGKVKFEIGHCCVSPC